MIPGKELGFSERLRSFLKDNKDNKGQHFSPTTTTAVYGGQPQSPELDATKAANKMLPFVVFVVFVVVLKNKQPKVKLSFKFR